MYRVTIYNGAISTIIHEVSVDPADPHLYNCTLTEGSPGEIDTLQFTILPNNPGYELLNSRTTMVEVLNTKTGFTEFSGRVLTITPEMEDNGLIYKAVVCEDRLGFLCDSIQPFLAKTTYYDDGERTGIEQFLDLILENHNSQVEDYKKIYRGTVSFTTSTDNVTKGLTYETTWECISQKLLTDLGGEIQLYENDGKLYLDYTTELGSIIDDVTIEFGRNMKSISQEIDPTSVITRLIPLGAHLEADGTEEEEVNTDDYVTIASVNNGVLYLDDEDAQKVYGIVEGTVTWEDVTEPSNLLTKAQAWLDQQTVTDKITLNALDLSLIGLDSDAIERYNYYRVANNAIGLDAYFRVVRRTVNICDPSDITYEMGERAQSLAATLTNTSNAASEATEAASAINAAMSKTVNTMIVAYLQSGVLEATFATITYLDAQIANVQSAIIDEATIEKLIASYGYITTADINTLLADYATINDLSAVTADIGTLTADIASINALLSGSIGSGTVQTIHLTADNSVIDEAVITTALINNAIMSTLLAGTIYTDYVTIMSESGNLYITDNTIQITDENGTVRVQIGEDASSDYNLYLWDSNGTLIWDAQGLTEAGLTGNGAIIKDAAVADDAAISGYKLDIDSVISCIEDDGSLTVDYAQVTINDSTLSAWYTTVNSSVSDLESETETLQTGLSVVQGQIEAKIWETDINTAVSGVETEITTLSDKYTSISADLDGVSSTVSSLTTTMTEYTETVDGLIKEHTIYYAVSTSPDYYPSTGDDGTTSVLGTMVLGQAVLGNSGEWTIDRPTVSEDEYLWQREYIVYADGTTEWTDPVLVTDTTTRDSVSALQSQYSTFEQTLDSFSYELGSLSTVVTENYEYTETRMSEFEVTLEGLSATASETLEQVGTLQSEAVTGTVTEYYKSTSSTECTGGTWTEDTPEWEDGTYIWVRTTVTTGVGDTAATTTSDPVCITGNTGASGSSGNDGASVSISSTEITYQASSSGTETPTGDWTADVPEVSQGEYLWTKTVVNYTLTASDGTTSTKATTSYSVAYIGSDGEQGEKGETGDAGRGIVSTAVYYAVTETGTYYPSFGDDGTTAILGVAELGTMVLGNTGEWLTEIPEITDGQYLWTLTIFTYSDGTTDRIYTVTKAGETGAQGIQGLQGEQGIQGEAGEDGKTTYFHVKYSTMESPTSSGDMTETPSTYIGTYVDYTEDDSTDPADYTWVKWIGEDGAQGIAGTDGTDGTTYYWHIAYANSEDGKTDFSVDDSTDKSYIGQYVDTSIDDSTDYAKYTWSKIKGEDGADGSDGVGIQSIKNYYLATSASSDVTVSTGGWTETVQSVSASKKYLWNYEIVTLTDGNTDISTPCIIGAYGDTGATGATGAAGTDGEDGVSISSVQEYYAVSTTNSSAPSAWSTSVATMTATNKYLWNYEVITYSDGNTSETAKRVIGVYGDTGAQGEQGEQGEKGDKGDTGADGSSVTIQSTKITYQATSSGTETPSGDWSESVPEMEAGQYLWTKTEVTYLLTASDGTTSTKTTTSYSISYIGVDGEKGDTGDAGVSVESVTIYYALSESSTYAPSHGDDGTTAVLGTMVLGAAVLGNSGEWYTEAPEVGETEYLWSCFLITYSNGVTSWTEPCCLTDDSTRNLVSTLNERVYEFEASLDGFLYSLESLQEDIYTNYSTTEEIETTINAKIEDSEASITSSIEATYATMEYADDAASTATTNANDYTDGLLTSYYNMEQTNSIIQTVTEEINEISLSVSSVKTTVDGTIKTYKVYYAVSESPDYYPTHGDDGTTSVLGTGTLGSMVLGNSGEWTETQPEAADGEYIWVSYYIEYADDDCTTEWTKPTLITDTVSRDGITSLTEKSAELTVSLDGISAQVSSVETEVYSNYTELIEKYSELVLADDSISASVSEAITTANGYTDSQITASLVLEIAEDSSGTSYGKLSANADYIEFTCGEFVINGDNGGQFTFDADGNATFSGELKAASGTFEGELVAATGTFSGELSAATGTFSGDLNAAGGTFTGTLNGVDGTFSGELKAATGTFQGAVNAVNSSSNLKATLADGFLRFYIDDDEAGSVYPSWNSNENATHFNIGPSSNAEALVIGKTYLTGYYQNYGANLDGYSEKHIFHDSILSLGTLTIKNGVSLKWYTTSGSSETFAVVTTGTTLFQIGNANYTTSIIGSSITTNTSITTGSDARLKTDFNTLESYSYAFDMLEPVSFRYIANDKKIHLGFTTQNIQEALYAAGFDADDHALLDSYTDEETGETYGSLAYSEIIALLVYEVQSLKKQLQALA